MFNKISIQENVILAPYTTFKIGGPAKYFFEAKSKDNLIDIIKWAGKNKMRYFILGGGSNILMADQGFDGLIIKLSMNNYQLFDKKIRAEAGMNLGKLVQIAQENNLSGLEWAIGIPGTVGGAIRGNAGAMGESMSDIVDNVEILTNSQTFEQWNNRQCQFGYRRNILQGNSNFIVVSTEIQLNKGNRATIDKTIKEYLEKRKSQPEEPSAGCVFKNIEADKLDSQLVKNLSNKYPEITNLIKGGKLSAGWLIEQAGLKGQKIGQAQISPQHANFIINLGQAKAEEVIILISFIKQQVRNKFGIQLQEEVEYVF